MTEIERHEARMVVTFDGDPQNALDDDLVAELERALAEAEQRGSTVLHLRARNAHFCGGASAARLRAWVADGGSEALLTDAKRWGRLFDRIEAAPAIVLAEIRGNALGAGLGLALACDLRIAATTAKFGVPEVRVGTLPAGLTLSRLSELGGPATARRLLLAGEIVDGTEAHRLGLVHWVADEAALEERARALAERLSRQSRDAVIEGKSLIAAGRRADPGLHDAEQRALTRLLACEDARTRLQALVDRLSPPASGRPSPS